MNQDDVSVDDIEDFVARMIVQPPPPLHSDDESYCHTSYTDNNDDTVTSAASSQLTSNHNVNNGSYPRAGCIDKTTDVYINVVGRRRCDLSLARPLHYSTYPSDYVNADLRPPQTTANVPHCYYNRPSLRWYDASYHCQQSSTDDTQHVRAATSLRPVSLQHE